MNIRRCIKEEEKPFVIIAKVRDTGSGNQVQSRVEVDLNRPGFKIIPLRPGFSNAGNDDDLTAVLVFVSLNSNLFATQVVHFKTPRPQLINIRIYLNRRHFFHCNFMLTFNWGFRMHLNSYAKRARGTGTASLAFVQL